jgi:hypothetical protein
MRLPAAANEEIAGLEFDRKMTLPARNVRWQEDSGSPPKPAFSNAFSTLYDGLDRMTGSCSIKTGAVLATLAPKA